MTERDAQAYLDFLKKFEAKKTTDDCYTPPAVYKAVYDFAQKHGKFEGLKILRPFIPNGDYKGVDYTGCGVIDNPPFSILAEVIDFYIAEKVPFFLFAPALTLFSYLNRPELQLIIISPNMTYDNGAKVRTGFITNALKKEDVRVWGCVELSEAIKEINESNKKGLAKYDFPAEVLTSTMVDKIVNGDVDFKVYKNEGLFIRKLDSQKACKKAIYGSGLLLSEEAMKRKEEAMKR
ncbi:MAG: chromosome partitioning protein ParB, partial [Flavobacteriaceae bacterium]|nr:chromosome partitioning protein ParB [Flavobacteriaceae bacterium]